ncbi:MAG: tetratricopeptide repeat protein [Gammaproteobacteria bacterium]|nr:tetratricopeptide repeat protein [Gammaproteobacteria bacterium]
MKNIPILIVTIVAMGALSVCSSPEEKAASHIANDDALYANGQLEKAPIEYKNALQLNQNQADAWYGLALMPARISNSHRNSTS